MPTIKIPFPIHEGFEVKNATIDLENGYTVVEYGKKEVQAINNYILVPENIGIYTVKAPANKERYGDGLLIGFNGYRQMLGYDSINQIYVVSQKDYLEIAQCKLTPCKREYLKAGDTAFFSDITEPIDISNSGCYCKMLDYQHYVYALEDGGIEVNLDNNGFDWYKVEPLQYSHGY